MILMFSIVWACYRVSESPEGLLSPFWLPFDGIIRALAVLCYLLAHLLFYLSFLSYSLRLRSGFIIKENNFLPKYLNANISLNTRGVNVWGRFFKSADNFHLYTVSKYNLEKMVSHYF